MILTNIVANFLNVFYAFYIFVCVNYYKKYTLITRINIHIKR